VTNIGLCAVTLCLSLAANDYPLNNPPAIADGNFSEPPTTLMRESSDTPQSVQWTASLKYHFPVGSDEGGLVATLRQQGFEIDGQQHTAFYSWGGMCRSTLVAKWTVNVQRQIASVSGTFEYGCI
jgi:hypothetical protein